MLPEHAGYAGDIPFSQLWPEACDQRMLSKYLKEATKYVLTKAMSKKGPNSRQHVSDEVKAKCSLKGQKAKPTRPSLEHLLNMEPWWNEGVSALKQILKDLDLQTASQQSQRQSYLGNHADLLEYMKDKNKKTMTTAALRTWLKKNGSFPSAYVKRGINLEHCDIDHILPRSVGGVDHPYNYHILPKKLNKRWSGCWTAHKLTYMGSANAKAAKTFFLWVWDEGKRLGVDYNTFDQKRLLS